MKAQKKNRGKKPTLSRADRNHLKRIMKKVQQIKVWGQLHGR